MESGMKIYVGNLPYDVTKEDLQTQFAAFGAVESVDIIIDRYSGRSKGFAFVEMPSVAEGQAAIAGLNGKMLKERPLNVSVARPRTDDRGDRPGGGMRSGGGYGGSRERR
jgi:RNA recognition motif-containing protein